MRIERPGRASYRFDFRSLSSRRVPRRFASPPRPGVAPAMGGDLAVHEFLPFAVILRPAS